jgi:inosose dehydratase
MITSKLGHTALTWTFDEPEKVYDAIRDCGLLGYRGTEMWGKLFESVLAEDAQKVRAALAESGVAIASMFEFGDWTDPGNHATMLEDARRWAPLIAEFGGDILVVVPGVSDRPVYSDDDYRQMADAMNRAGEIASAAGVRAAMHPHGGTPVETEEQIDTIMGLLDPALVGFAPDSGQMAKGGGDPAAISRKYAERIWHVHIKDLAKEWPELRAQGVTSADARGYVELGQGTVDLPAFIQVLDEVDYSGWLMVELDATDLPPFDSAKLSGEYLRSALAAQSGISSR